MVTNFDYLKNESRFSDFAEVAISAEKIILIDPQASIINCRRAMEFAVKWMYSVDEELEMPYQDNLQSLMNNEDFRDIVGPDIWKRMDYIRRCGNNAAHSNKKLGKDIAMLCLENLFIYLDFVACCYSGNYEERTFDRSVLTERIEKAKESKKLADVITLTCRFGNMYRTANRMYSETDCMYMAVMIWKTAMSSANRITSAGRLR